MFILMQNIFIVPGMQQGRRAKPLLTKLMHSLTLQHLNVYGQLKDRVNLANLIFVLVHTHLLEKNSGFRMLTSAKTKRLKGYYIM